MPGDSDEIREAIDFIVLEIGTEDDQSAFISRKTYEYRWTWIRFFSTDSTGTQFLPVSRADAKRIVEAVRGLFFVYEWGPRKFLAEIRVNGQVRGGLVVGFQFYIDA